MTEDALSTVSAPAGAPTAAVAPPRQRLRLGTFDSLRYRNYRFHWIGVLGTSGGLWMEQIALNWLVYDLTGSAVVLSILNGLRVLPALFASPLGGVAADRINRKALMLGTQWTLLVFYLALAALIATGLLQVWHLMIFSLGTGIAWSFNQPVRQAILPGLVPRELMANAAALQTAGHNMTRMVGPAAGGFIMGTIGAAGAILAEALTSVVVLVATYLLRLPPNPPRGKDAPGPVQDLLEGFRFIRRAPDVGGLIVMALVPFIFVFPYMTLLTIFAKDIFHFDAAGLGMMMSVSGIGAVLATLAVASLGGYRGKGKLLVWLNAAMSLTLIGFALSSWLPLALLMLALVSGASMAYTSLTNTLILLIVPNTYRGRVMSVYMLDRGVMPLGGMVAGALAALWGAPAALALLGAAALLFTVVAYFAFPTLRRLE
jgi:predicted MFS family arabinose efflux permease